MCLLYNYETGLNESSNPVEDPLSLLLRDTTCILGARLPYKNPGGSPPGDESSPLFSGYSLAAVLEQRLVRV